MNYTGSSSDASKMLMKSDQDTEGNPPRLYGLDEACKKFFPGLGITVRDLRAEADTGRLTIDHPIARKCRGSGSSS
jgi:hypothetical protein